MYGHTDHSLIDYTSAEFVGHFPLLDMTAPQPPNYPAPSPLPLVVPTGNYEFDPTMAVALALKQEMAYSSSGCSSYESPSSLSSYSAPTPSLMQRSVSSHTLNKKNTTMGLVQLIHQASPAEFFDSETGPVRKVFSTGDLQRMNMRHHWQRPESPLSNENSILIGGIMSKACPYSPEEKKERIERYRSKRNQRNFNKKIKYECRKTLADSRPRIRGRFAKNDEIEKSPETENSSLSQWSRTDMGVEDGEDDENWATFLDSFSGNLIP